MATSFPFQVNGVDCPTPSEFVWSRQQVSAADSGRTQDGVMHVNRVAMKDKIQLSWNAPKPDKAAQILQMFDSEYFEVTYRNPLTNSVVTKTMYRGDATANTYWWANNGLFEKISFNIIEK